MECECHQMDETEARQVAHEALVERYIDQRSALEPLSKRPARSRSPLPRTTVEAQKIDMEQINLQVENVVNELNQLLDWARVFNEEKNHELPSHTANRLKTFLLRAKESSKELRAALEKYEKIAQQNEALFLKAQQMLSQLLEQDD